MPVLGQIFIVAIAIQHLLFCILEMFFWHKPLGLKIFRQKPELALQTRALAANQGLYNGFLAIGLLTCLIAPAGNLFFARFFFACIIVAGVFGAATVSKRILWIQAFPSFLALAYSLVY